MEDQAKIWIAPDNGKSKLLWVVLALAVAGLATFAFLWHGERTSKNDLQQTVARQEAEAAALRNRAEAPATEKSEVLSQLETGRQAKEDAPAELANANPEPATQPAIIQLQKTVDTQRQKAEVDLKAAEESLATIQGQCKTEADAIDALQKQLKNKKKDYHNVSSVMNLLSSAYGKLEEGNEGDPELNTAIGYLQRLDKEYVAPKTTTHNHVKTTTGSDSQWTYDVNGWITKYSRAESHVSKAEEYLLEKLNQISKLIDFYPDYVKQRDPQKWINTDLWEFPTPRGRKRSVIPDTFDNKATVLLKNCNCHVWTYTRNRIKQTIEQIKEIVDNLKNPQTDQAIQQQIDEKQKHFLEIGAKINSIKSTIKSLKLQVQDTVIPPPPPPDEQPAL